MGNPLNSLTEFISKGLREMAGVFPAGAFVMVSYVIMVAAKLGLAKRG